MQTSHQGETFAAFLPENNRLSGMEFNDCVFKDCRWVGVRVENCTFTDCTFEHCSMSGVVFAFTRMRDSWLRGSSFRSMAWGGLQGRSALGMPFTSAQNCAFQYNDFSGMALAGFDFSTCNFMECSFDECSLKNAVFNGVPLARSRFTRCDLTGADFRSASGYGIDPADNKLRGARFSFPDVVALLDGTGIQIE